MSTTLKTEWTHILQEVKMFNKEVQIFSDVSHLELMNSFSLSQSRRSDEDLKKRFFGEVQIKKWLTHKGLYSFLKFIYLTDFLYLFVSLLLTRWMWPNRQIPLMWRSAEHAHGFYHRLASGLNKTTGAQSDFCRSLSIELFSISGLQKWFAGLVFLQTMRLFTRSCFPEQECRQSDLKKTWTFALI